MYTNLLLISERVASYQTFVESVNEATFAFVYTSLSSHVDLLSVLPEGITRIGIVSHGNLDELFFGAPLFIENEVAPFSANMQFIIQLLKGVSNIDFLACNTLNNPAWQAYFALLQQTGVIVGASDDRSGNIKYGGDWTMESTGQDIELVYFTDKIEQYQYLLIAPPAPTVVTPVIYTQNATVVALTAITTTGSSLLWYFARSAGTGNPSAPIPSTTHIDSTNYYVAQINSGVESVRTSITVTIIPAAPIVESPVACFLRGSRILCLNGNNEEYLPIENLTQGQYVKTYLHGYKPIKLIAHRSIHGDIYKLSQSQYTELERDLYLTGCHSVLVDKLSWDEEQNLRSANAIGTLYITDDMYRLEARFDKRATYIEGDYEVWHLALEHSDEAMNYGIYANGLLVESCSAKNMKNSFMI